MKVKCFIIDDYTYRVWGVGMSVSVNVSAGDDYDNRTHTHPTPNTYTYTHTHAAPTPTAIRHQIHTLYKETFKCICILSDNYNHMICC